MIEFKCVGTSLKFIRAHNHTTTTKGTSISINFEFSFIVVYRISGVGLDLRAELSKFGCEKLCSYFPWNDRPCLCRKLVCLK